MAKRTEIYIGGGELQAVTWRETEEEKRITGFFAMPLPEGCIVNGKIGDRHRFADAVRKFSGECGFSLERSGLVLDLEGILAKILEVPAGLKRKAVLYAVRGELGILKEDETYFYDFCGIRSWRTSKDQGNGKAETKSVLGYGMERDLALGLEAVFREAGIRILKIRVASGCVIRMAEQRNEFRKGTGILCVLNGHSSWICLLSDGACIMQGRSRLMQERGSQKTVEELAGRIGAVRKFAREKGNMEPVEYIYFGGLTPEEEAGCVKIEKITGIRTGVLCPESGSGDGAVPPGMNFHLAASMSHGTEKEENLLAAAGKRQVTSLEKKWTWSPWICAALLPAAAILTAWGLVELGNSRLEEKVYQAESCAQDENIREEYRTVLNDMEEAERLRNIRQQLEKLEQEHENSVLPDSGLFLTIMEQSRGIMCSDFRYSGDSGSISFRGFAEDSHDIHEFIRRLRESGEFGEVLYDGYSYEPSETGYLFEVNCRLNGEGGEEHVPVQ